MRKKEAFEFFPYGCKQDSNGKKKIFRDHKEAITKAVYAMDSSTRDRVFKQIFPAKVSGIKFVKENICIYCDREKCKFYPAKEESVPANSKEDLPEDFVGVMDWGPTNIPGTRFPRDKHTPYSRDRDPKPKKVKKIEI